MLNQIKKTWKYIYLTLINLYRYNLGQGIQVFHFDYTTFYIIE